VTEKDEKWEEDMGKLSLKCADKRSRNDGRQGARGVNIGIRGGRYLIT
jgi:hypothetical protein